MARQKHVPSAGRPLGIEKCPSSIRGLDEITGGGLPRLLCWLKEKGVTAVITGEQGEKTLTRHGLEEYVSDCVIFLDHRIEAQSSTEREELRQQPEEARQTLEAIRHGDVDALVVVGPQGEQVCTLAGAEHVYRVIVETMNEAALTVDRKGAILFCNRRFCELMKTSISGAMGRKVTAFVAPPQQPSLQRLLAEACVGLAQRHLLLRATDGTPVPVQLAARPLVEGGCHSICLVASDVTELEASAHSVRVLRRHQQALEESEHRCRELLRCAPAGIYEIDFRRQRFTSVNDTMCHLSGYSRDELLTMNPLGLLDEDGQVRLRARIDRWLHGGKPEGNVEYRVKTKDGRILDVLLDVMFTTDKDGKPLGATVVGHDITERKKTEEALRDANENLRAQAEQLRTANDLLQAKQLELERANEDLERQEQDLRQQAEALQASQEWLSLAASGSRVGMYDWNVVTGEALWTEQVARLLGLRTTTTMTTTTTTVFHRYHYRDWAARVHPEDLPRVKAGGRRCLAERTPCEDEYRVVWPDGSVRWIADRGVFQYESDGQGTRMLGIMMDITDRKRAEEALRESEGRYRGVVQNTTAVILRVDPGGIIRFANERALQFFGYSAEELIGRHAVGSIIPEREATGRDLAAMVAEIVKNPDRFHTNANENMCKNGQRVWMEWTNSGIYDGEGRLKEFLAVGIDATERRRAEETLRDLNATLESKVTQRTAELAQRARQLQKLTLELSQAEERERRRIAVVLHEDLQQQISGAKFHLSLLRGRIQPEVQQEVVHRIDEMLKEAIEKSRRLSHDLSPAVLHMNDLAEVLLWLAKQVWARYGLTVHVDVMGEAMLQSESLTMFLFRAAQEVLLNVVKHARVNEATIRVRRMGRHVCFCISDTGRGFDPRQLKDTAGFGLLGVRERVELLGGRMKIRSIKDRGTAVRIVVPDDPQKESTRGQ
jgi:PAS domain S-box-containing protein